VVILDPRVDSKRAKVIFLKGCKRYYQTSREAIQALVADGYVLRVTGTEADKKASRLFKNAGDWKTHSYGPIDFIPQKAYER